jgi:hypothetical protein
MLALEVFTRVPAVAIAATGFLSVIVFTKYPTTRLMLGPLLIYPLCAVLCGAVVGWTDVEDVRRAISVCHGLVRLIERGKGPLSKPDPVTGS